jgi:hypothetical protein
MMENKMISIKELLKKRANYPLSKNGDNWLDEVLSDETKDEVWLITVSSSLLSMENINSREQITAKYFVAGSYNLGTPYINTGVRMELLHLTKECRDKMDVSIYKGQMFIAGFRKGKNIDNLFALPERYSAKYEKYIDGLEKWINGGDMPEDDSMGEYEYNSVNLSNVSEARINPEFFSKKAMEVRKFLQQEELVRLGDVAEIIMPRPIGEEVGKVVRSRDLKYPFEVNGIQEKQITNVTIKKNDILLPMIGDINPFLVADDVNDTIYVDHHILVLRCKEVQPEYLFLYLNSEVCQTIIDSQNMGGLITRITRKIAEEIPVIIPTKDENDYCTQAYLLTHPEKRSYQSKDYNTGVNDYWKDLQQNQIKKAEKVEDILSMEILQKMKVHSTNQLQDMLQEDWKELNDCFRVKAYKATLILAGSILEAVLIDWLSEIKGEDYFVNDYMVTTPNGREKRADLIDYIKEIKYIEYPEWINEAEKAHEIRKKRNLVHAKLGINSDEINEETCRMVIGYLKDVISTRGVEQ